MRRFIKYSIVVGAVLATFLVVKKCTQTKPLPTQKVNLSLYPKELQEIKTLKKQLKNHSNKEVKAAFINVLTNKIFPYWYGTNWDFNGTTQKPNQGKIACGYFVTTTLRDAGVSLNRVKLAQCASEEMISKLVSKDKITRFSNISMHEFETKLSKNGDNIFVIGLDNHTGFIQISKKGNYFIHSSGIAPYKVIKEKLSDAVLVKHSKYRVVGNITNDPTFLKKWIEN